MVQTAPQLRRASGVLASSTSLDDTCCTQGSLGRNALYLASTKASNNGARLDLVFIVCRNDLRHDIDEGHPLRHSWVLTVEDNQVLRLCGFGTFDRPSNYELPDFPIANKVSWWLRSQWIDLHTPVLQFWPIEGSQAFRSLYLPSVFLANFLLRSRWHCIREETATLHRRLHSLIFQHPEFSGFA